MDIKKITGVAQYGPAKWDNVIGMAKGISVEDAKAIADDDPEITFFFYTKGGYNDFEYWKE